MILAVLYRNNDDLQETVARGVLIKTNHTQAQSANQLKSKDLRDHEKQILENKKITKYTSPTLNSAEPHTQEVLYCRRQKRENAKLFTLKNNDRYNILAGRGGRLL